MALLNLFLSFAKIGLLSIGGAYSFLPMIENEVVKKYHWITPEEFLDIAGFTSILPGAISVKFASYIGYKIGGALGILATNMGLLVAPISFVFLLTFLLKKYEEHNLLRHIIVMVRFAVIGMILAIGFQYLLDTALKQTNSITIIYGTLILTFALNAILWGKLSPALIIILTIFLAIIVYFIKII